MAIRDLITQTLGFNDGIGFIPRLGLSGLVVQAPVNVTLPVISGAPTQDTTLRASNGTWLNTPTSFTYQWYRDGILIVGATSANYTAVAADVGHALTVAVTASNAGGSATATSLPTANVQASTTGTGEEVWYDWKRRQIQEEEDFAGILACLGALDLL